MATPTQVQALYIAYFGRPADPVGLDFWTKDGDQSSEEVMDQMADMFAITDEYTSATAGKNLEEIISGFYQNLFNREPEPDGLAFWVEQVANGNSNTQDVGLFIGRAALETVVADGEVNTDQQSLTSKTAAASLFTAEVASSLSNTLAYSGDAGIAAGKAFLDPVVNKDTIPDSGEISSAVDGIVSGSGGSGGGGAGGLVNTLALTAFTDLASPTATQVYDPAGLIPTNSNGQLLSEPRFALTAANQTVTGTAGSVQAADVLTDASTADTDSLTITGATATLANLTSTNIENINFTNLAVTAAGTTLIRNGNASGITATGVSSITASGTTSQLITVTATGSGASAINVSGITGTGTTAITADGVATTITGSALNDSITGAAGGDTIDAGAGTNTITDAGNGADTINSTVTSTTAIAVTGSGTVTVGAAGTGLTFTSADGTDTTVNAATSTVAVTLTGGTGDDTLTGGSGGDTIDGGAGVDTINAGGGTNTITDVGNGADVINSTVASTTGLAVAGTGTVTVTAAGTGLTFTAGTGVATTINAATSTVGVTFVGNTAIDTHTGGAGNDNFTTGSAADVIVGGAGDDILYKNAAGGGSLTGGDDADQFRVNSASVTTLLDFTDGTDLIGLFDNNTDASAGSVNFAGTTATTAGAALAATDFATLTAVLGTGLQASHVNMINTAITNAEVAAIDVTGATAYLVVFNSDAGHGQLWYDSDWDDKTSGRILVAEIDSLDANGEVAALTAADFVAFL